MRNRNSQLWTEIATANRENDQDRSQHSKKNRNQRQRGTSIYQKRFSFDIHMKEIELLVDGIVTIDFVVKLFGSAFDESWRTIVEGTIESRDCIVLVDAWNKLAIVIVGSSDGSMLADDWVVLIILQISIINILLINRYSGILPVCWLHDRDHWYIRCISALI
jgi:hypothetical protein